MEPSGGAEYTRIDVKEWPGSSQAANYAAKYAGKTFEEGQIGQGRRRFLAPQGGIVPVEQYAARSLDQVRLVVECIEGARVFESGGEGEGKPSMLWAGW